ncbi:single-stranded DNA-binding protein [Nonomuraea sp. NPDC003804]|uniref:single-stranded DNA-binding protein n=1 Tax=Nonomuraea sp. NPDC003804 TaxID=3154547 RepID=UPI0033AE25A4
MNDIYITLTGNVAAPPRQHAFADGARVTSLRVATRHRFFDRKTQEWSDGDTVFFAVRCWRTLGDNVAQSFQVGHPVVVCGKLRIREFGPEGDRRFMPEIEASSIGHDLRWGVGAFSKPERSGGIGTLSRETRESLDESTQDWAMSGSATARALHGRPAASRDAEETSARHVEETSARQAEQTARDDVAGWPFAPAAGPGAASGLGLGLGPAFAETGAGITAEPVSGPDSVSRAESVDSGFGFGSGSGSQSAFEAGFRSGSAPDALPESGSEAGSRTGADSGSGAGSARGAGRRPGSAVASTDGDTTTLTPGEGDDSPSEEPGTDPGEGHPAGAGKVRLLNPHDAPQAPTGRTRRAKAA